ncbi:hypothetical protein TC41_0666 [Alicyclobacillus acidocaldarius subsp. acidocaldarius Tc-4-1]|uniref:Uncharacterized protein n=1 Tax=Alicyclobacillus acidocaldarius (strain Tc-4-1) TaxID=1048834 RepID=F8IDX0_ALIAT|nr:hypothetical protein TC41_0666 [Alicyclobacillus acidocaldarius subsp. acidocaldarius Tc-4-1]
MHLLHATRGYLAREQGAEPLVRAINAWLAENWSIQAERGQEI